jgi:hypothetical protein
MATFTAPNGERPSEFILHLAQQVFPTVGEAQYGGQALRTRIGERTAAGMDYTGAAFAEYSDAYRKRKVLTLGQSDTVDLFGAEAHPHMLNAIMVETDNTSELASAHVVSLVIPEPEATRARAHNEGAVIRTRLGTGKGKPKKNGKATFTLPMRRFFDVTPEDIEFMEFAIVQRRDERLSALFK